MQGAFHFEALLVSSLLPGGRWAWRCGGGGASSSGDGGGGGGGGDGKDGEGEEDGRLLDLAQVRSDCLIKTKSQSMCLQRLCLDTAGLTGSCRYGG